MIEIEEMIGDMIGIGGMTGVHLAMIVIGEMIGAHLAMIVIGEMIGDLHLDMIEMEETMDMIAEEMIMIETMSEIKMAVEDLVKRMKRNPEYQNSRSMRSPNLKMLLPPTSLLSYKKRRPAVGAVRKIS